MFKFISCFPWGENVSVMLGENLEIYLQFYTFLWSKRNKYPCFSFF